MNNLVNLSVKIAPVFKTSVLFSNSSASLPCSVSILGTKSKAALFHSSSVKFKFGPPKPRPAVYKKPVDWLPFEWHRRPRYSLFEDGGDHIKEIVYDPSSPKPDFELSEELKTADEQVKNTFSLATASKAEKKEVMKREILKRIQQHPFDYHSLEVQIALRTIQIRSLYEHYRDNIRKEKKVSTIVFPIIIQKRNALLNKLWNIDTERFNWILQELDLHYSPPDLQLPKEKYCKKWHLRSLTKEHCAKVIADKKGAYHEELKKQQIEFLEEKKKILAWIEEEENALESL